MYEDEDPKHLIELPESEIAIIEDGLVYMEESLNDIAAAYKRGREDNYYKFFDVRAKEAKRIRKKLEEMTRVKTPSMSKYEEESDEYMDKESV